MAFQRRSKIVDTTEQDNIAVITRFLSSQVSPKKVHGERYPDGNYVFTTSMMIEYNPKTTTYTLGFSKWKLTSQEFNSVVNVLLNGEHPVEAVFAKFNNKFKIDLED